MRTLSVFRYLSLISIINATLIGNLFAGSLVITETDGTTAVNEGLELDYLNVSLSSQPTATVSVKLSPATADLELNGGFPGDSITLVFGTADWSTPQAVSVRAVQDDISEGSHTCQIIPATTSNDSGFNNISSPQITVHITDFQINPCPTSDIDGDCAVSMSDLEILAIQWLNTNCSGEPCANLAGDSNINLLDFNQLSKSWDSSFGPVVISEFMALNGSTDPEVAQESWELFDENNAASDWIELYNLSDKTVSLAGWHLTDDSDDLAKWSFPATATIAPNAYLVIFASGNDTVNGSYIHTNFSLSGSGGYLAIINPDGKVVQEYDYPGQVNNISYGSSGYFSEVRYFSPATPGSANTGSIIGAVTDTKFSVKRGFYTTPFYVEITTDELDTQIRYTTDGSTPSMTNGTLYNPASPIYIYKTTTLRATAYKPGWIPSNVDTQTYIFVSDVITQSPNGEVPGAGWPADGAVNGHRMFYGMDPDIVNNPEYAGLMQEALTSIPSLSIVTDLENLFNPTDGVYVNVSNETRTNGEYYEQPISLELIDPNGTESGFQIDCGLRLRGGYSRQATNPKHSLRFYFRSKYGKAKLKYPLFGDEGTDEFDKIDLRTSANYSWHNLWQGVNNGMGALNTYTRDEYSRLMQGIMGHPYTKGRYYHLYINGQYWGLYQTEERVDARFAASYLPGNTEEFDVLKTDLALGRQVVATEGNAVLYHQLYNAIADGISSDEEYYRLQGMNPDGTRNPSYTRLLDVENLMDYMLLEYYPADYDGPGSRFVGINNFSAIINRNNPDGFKWLQHDGEHSFGAYEGQDAWRENMVTPLTTQGSNINYFNPHWLHEQLAKQNRLYRTRFADRVQELFFNNGLFTPDKVYEIMNGLARQINTAIIGESARWGDTVVTNPRTRNNWLDALQFTYNWVYGTSSQLNSDWTLNSRQTWPKQPRPQRVISQFRSVNWFPSVDAPAFAQHGGVVANNYNLTINGTDTIYYTTDGADPMVPSTDSSPTVDTILVAENAPKYVLIPNSDINIASNSLFVETFTGINGTAVSDLTSSAKYINNTPDSYSIWSSFTLPTIDYLDNYGIRARGLLYPPTTGTYYFWIASDDNSSLLLSTDKNPANASEIAHVSNWTNSNEWYKEPANQKSAAISLVAGTPYYIEALMKEGSGGDNLSVGWAVPGTSTPTVISGAYLSTTGNPWTDINFDHSSWISGSGAVAYETQRNSSDNYNAYVDNGINVQSMMFNVTPGCYIRIPFTCNNDNINRLTLKLRYDDGFVAYLNGVEIARDNVNDSITPLNYLTTAINYRSSDTLAMTQTSFDVSKYIGLLNSSNNVLSIHGFNNATSSSDFLMSAELVASQIPAGTPSPSAIAYAGPVTLDKSVEVKARAYSGSEWSAMTKATFGVGPLAESLRITELMYNPEDPNHEFIEIKNISSTSVNLNKVEFTKGVNHVFGDISMAAGQYLVLVANKTMFLEKYPSLPANCIVEQWTSGELDNSKELIRFKDAIGNIIQEFEYKDWYAQTDGQGFSLTLLDPTDSNLSNWGLKDSWTVSTYPGGSPGEYEQALAANSIVINEILAHSHDTAPDWIELYNTTSQSINIGGWYLSDSQDNLQQYQIPSVTVPANGYVVLYQNTDFGDYFALSENGDELYLSSAIGGILTGYQVSEDFGASATGVSFGRYQKSDGSYNFVAMNNITPGTANTLPAVGPVVITEIMYNPYDEDDAEYIELQNITSAPVDLWYYDANSGVTIPWRLIDDDGIVITLPLNVTMTAGQKLLLIKNTHEFTSEFGSVPAGVTYYQWGASKLSNGGEKLELQMPGDTDGTTRYYIRVDRVNYDDTAPWPTTPDGNGDSLNRIIPNQYGNDSINWMADIPTPGL